MAAKTAFVVLIACAAVASFASPAIAADANAGPPVYRCKQASGGVVYQDYPCKGGVVVDIKPDAADPDAIRRLQRAQAEFDRSVAQRKADEAMAAMQREALDQRRRELEAAQSYAESSAYPPDSSYVPAYGFYAPYVQERSHRFKHRAPAEHRRIAPEGRVPAVIRRPHPG